MVTLTMELLPTNTGMVGQPALPVDLTTPIVLPTLNREEKGGVII